MWNKVRVAQPDGFFTKMVDKFVLLVGTDYEAKQKIKDDLEDVIVIYSFYTIFYYYFFYSVT